MPPSRPRCIFIGLCQVTWNKNARTPDRLSKSRSADPQEWEPCVWQKSVGANPTDEKGTTRRNRRFGSLRVRFFTARSSVIEYCVMSKSNVSAKSREQSYTPPPHRIVRRRERIGWSLLIAKHPQFFLMINRKKAFPLLSSPWGHTGSAVRKSFGRCNPYVLFLGVGGA